MTRPLLSTIRDQLVRAETTAAALDFYSLARIEALSKGRRSDARHIADEQATARVQVSRSVPTLARLAARALSGVRSLPVTSVNLQQGSSPNSRILARSTVPSPTWSTNRCAHGLPLASRP